METIPILHIRTCDIEIQDGTYIPPRGQNEAPRVIYHNPDLNELTKIGGPTRGKVLIYIHGHNCTESEAIATMRKIITEMDKQGRRHNLDTNAVYVCVTWSARCNETWFGCRARGSTPRTLWRSATSWLGPWFYVDDLERIARSFRNINWLINDIARTGREIHLMGHSMGCQAILHYLDRVAHDYRTLTFPYPYYGAKVPQPSTIHAIVSNLRTVMMFAPDVQVPMLRAFVGADLPIFWVNCMKKFLIFSNRWDLALRASKWIRIGSDRVGIPMDAVNILNHSGLGNPSDTIEIINVNDLSLLGHQYCADARVALRAAYAVFDPRTGVGHTNAIPPVGDDTVYTVRRLT